MTFLRRWGWAILILATAAFGFVGCTNEDATLRTLRGAGYSKIEVTGFRWTTCGIDEQSDHSCTGFRAQGPTGIMVTGAVGCGWFGKGCTIRMD